MSHSLLQHKKARNPHLRRTHQKVPFPAAALRPSSLTTARFVTLSSTMVP